MSNLEQTNVEFQDNLGLGMWSFELFAGTTLYFDQARSWHFATNAVYETHTEKEGSDVRVGDLLTLEGGLGKSFMDGAISVGVAYCAPWKMSHDDLGLDLEPTPRWTACDAARYGIRVGEDVSMTTQERADISPIWYTP